MKSKSDIEDLERNIYYCREQQRVLLKLVGELTTEVREKNND